MGNVVCLRGNGVLQHGCKAGHIEVVSIAVDGINHLTFAKCYDCLMLGSNVVQLLHQLCHGDTVGLVCCSASVLSALRIVLSTSEPY